MPRAHDPAPFTASSIIDDAGFQRISRSKITMEQGFEYSIPYGWEVVTNGTASATVDPLQRSVILSCGTTSGDRILLQRKSTVRWRWGHSMMLNFSLVPNYLNTVLTGATKIRVGFFDDFNGQFLELNAAGAFLVFRSYVTGTVTEIPIPQSSWSNDKLDGTGISKFLVDWSKVQRIWHSASSPGAGRGRFGVYFRERFLQATQISSVNSRTSIPFLQTVALPPRLEIVNTGGGGSGALSQLYSVAMWEEGPDDDGETGYVTSCGNGVTLKSALSSDYLPLFSIRLTDAMNGLIMRGRTIPIALSILNASNNPAHIMLSLNASLTGASFVDIDAAHSCTQVDTSATAVTGGIRLASGYTSASNQGAAIELPAFPQKIFLARNYAGIRDTLTVAARGIGGTATVAGEMILRELY